MGFMGGDAKADKWDFTHANKLVPRCNGPTCGLSPRAIERLLKIGHTTTASSATGAANRCGNCGE